MINSKVDEIIDWKLMSGLEMEKKLIKFLDRFVMTDILNQIRIQNINKNCADIEDFMGRLGTGTETIIPHYQLAIKANSLCTKKKGARSF